jgi:two-component system, LytTR family, response regulator
MIHAVVADDEVLARQKLRQLLRDDRDIEIVGESATALETIELVKATNPELLFLDIRMPGMDGFDVVDALANHADLSLPRIIFTTAYDQYALRAFEVNAVDYLLKPFTLERLRSAIERVREQSQVEAAGIQRRRTGTARASTFTPTASSSSRAAAFCFCPFQTFAGLAPRAIMCGFRPQRKPTFCGKPWLTLRSGSIRADSCACIARSL